MPRGTHGSFWDPPEMGKMCGLNSPFWSDFSVSLTISELLGIRNTNLICQIIECQGTCDLCYYCVQWLWFQTWFDCQEVPSLARHGQFEERWSSSFKSTSEVKGYSHWNYKGLFPSTLVTVPLSGPKATLILVWWHLGGSYIGVVRLGRKFSVLCSYQSYCGQEFTQSRSLALRWRECFPQQFSLGGILEGYSDCTLGGIRGKQGFNGVELDVSQGCHQVYPWCISTPSRW